MRIFLGDDRERRAAAVRAHLGDVIAVEDRSAREWPFRRAMHRADVVWIRDLHLAFPAGQAAGTRLVLTQSTYQLQRWLDWLDADPRRVVAADASAAHLRRLVPEAAARRGPWSRLEVVDVESANGVDEVATTHEEEADAPAGLRLHATFAQPDPRVRFDACRSAIDERPHDPALLLAFASACSELQLHDAARDALDAALAAAPDWEAVHFEDGKWRLRTEDTAGAAAAFTTAVRLMPTFAAAWSNLGAALGELERPADAVAALHRALVYDPYGYPALNNLGAAYRELGQLAEAADAFREAIAIAPSFVFGYYNLGHTRFLQGDFAGARAAYEEGFGRDPQKNPRQACRLAVARAAAGDTAGAMTLLESVRRDWPLERTRDGMEEAESTLAALSAIPGMNTDALTRLREALRELYSS